MNESFYIELLIECMYEYNVIVQVTSLDVMSLSENSHAVERSKLSRNLL